MLKPTANIELLTTHLAAVQDSHDADPFAHALAEEDAFSGTKNVYFSPHLVGYAGTFSPELVDKIRQDPMVEFVEKDSIVKTQEVEKGAPWVSPHSRPSLANQAGPCEVSPPFPIEDGPHADSLDFILPTFRVSRGCRTGSGSLWARLQSTSTTTWQARASMSVSVWSLRSPCRPSPLARSR